MGGIAWESCPKLLNLMPSRGVQEEKKLELRLGPPGNDNKDGDFEKPYNASSQKRSAPGPLVGWPPVRSFRNNITTTTIKSASPPPHDHHKKLVCENPTEESNGQVKDGSGGGGGSGSMFVKINMEGVGIGRKVDLMAYGSYYKLSSAVDVLFSGLLQAQRDKDGLEELEPTKGEYTLVYEDNEGERMLLGDVPWIMFLSTVKRLRVMKKTSQVSSLCVGGDKHDRIPHE